MSSIMIDNIDQITLTGRRRRKNKHSNGLFPAASVFRGFFRLRIFWEKFRPLCFLKGSLKDPLSEGGITASYSTGWWHDFNNHQCVKIVANKNLHSLYSDFALVLTWLVWGLKQNLKMMTQGNSVGSHKRKLCYILAALTGTWESFHRRRAL